MATQRMGEGPGFDPRLAALAHAGAAEAHGHRAVDENAMVLGEATSAVACGLVYVGDKLAELVGVQRGDATRELIARLPLEVRDATTFGFGVTYRDEPLDPRFVKLISPNGGPDHQPPPRSEVISRLLEQLDPEGTNVRLRTLIETVMVTGEEGSDGSAGD